MKHIFCIPVLLCLYASGLAQPIPPVQKGLTIGDTMPAVMLSNIYNYPLKQTPFTALQQELTILDFWATWCGACVGAFDKMHALQAKYKGRLQVLMVNASPKEDAKKVNSFFAWRKKRTGNSFTLPYLLQDTVLSQLFPFKVIPHSVWVNKERRVIAITDTDALNEANIEAVLNGKPAQLPFKNDALLFDESSGQLLPAAADSGTAPLLLQQSFITAGQPGLGSQVLYESAGKRQVKRLRVINYSLMSLYQIAFAEAFSKGQGRTVVDTALQTLFEQERPIPQRSKYCYELYTRPVARKAAIQFLAADLQRYFNAAAVGEEALLPVYILKPGNNIQALQTRGGPTSSDLEPDTLEPSITNSPMATLTGFLEQLLHMPVVDSTGLLYAIDLQFPRGVFQYSPQQLQQFLQKQGFNLQQGHVRLPVTRLKPFNN